MEHAAGENNFGESSLGGAGEVLFDIEEKTLDPILGPLPDGAGIDDNFSGRLPSLTLAKTAGLIVAGNALGVRFIGLTTEGLDEIFLHLPNLLLQRFADAEVDHFVTLDGLTGLFIAERDDLFIGDLGNVEGAKTGDDNFVAFVEGGDNLAKKGFDGFLGGFFGEVGFFGNNVNGVLFGHNFL